jgi:hypothetical protein
MEGSRGGAAALPQWGLQARGLVPLVLQPEAGAGAWAEIGWAAHLLEEGESGGGAGARETGPGTAWAAKATRRGRISE